MGEKERERIMLATWNSWRGWGIMNLLLDACFCVVEERGEKEEEERAKVMLKAHIETLDCMCVVIKGPIQTDCACSVITTFWW